LPTVLYTKGCGGCTYVCRLCHIRQFLNFAYKLLLDRPKRLPFAQYSKGFFLHAFKYTVYFFFIAFLLAEERIQYFLTKNCSIFCVTMVHRRRALKTRFQPIRAKFSGANNRILRGKLCTAESQKYCASKNCKNFYNSKIDFKNDTCRL
jgi:hypothetical protein